MEHIKKLYGKAYHLYTIEDWKYIFSVYKEKDKYNHTEEEFLAAELIDKTAMMKKMDEAIWKDNPFSKQSMDTNESIFEPCPRDEGCKVIQDFLEDEDVKDRNPSKYEVPTCNPENSCDVIQDFLDTKDESYALYLSIKEDVYKNIQYHEDIINDLLTEIKRNLVMIDESKHRLKISYARYIKIV